MVFFSSKQARSDNFPGSVLTISDQLKIIEENSFSIPQIIFKHSTRCSISRFVLESFVASYNYNSSEFEAWYLDLLAYRAISDDITNKFGITHQSPQLIVIKNGKAVSHVSHDQIVDFPLEDYKG